MKPTLKDFLLANLSALLRGRFFMRDGHLPPAGHDVPEGFAGVGVATNADPATDEAVIRILNEAGIRRVRLDFTYGDGENHVARFLEALIAADFDVMLHLVQPAEDAQAMPGGAAEEAWQSFVSTTLDRFGSRIGILEACSTVNRKRWAGYSLEGLLCAWQIAHIEARKRGITLAGPSVTDFEPVWNIGLLRLLRDRGLLPDIHTDNLFSERCTEPERWDHKILGYTLAPLIRFNLIRKARLLQRIGADFGVPRLMSPAAFWTLPRIERFLPDSEQKQADYLSRYMVLCAASGALEAAWWGPLVCHREGLVDDGDFPYPKLERITHYTAVDGVAASFRARPALAALAGFAKLIPGSTYEGRLAGKSGLEVHAFRKDHELIHAVWTTNALSAYGQDLYGEDDLREARALSRDGVDLKAPPLLFNEKPTYLCWPDTRTVAVNAAAAPLKDVRVHVHGRRMAHYFRKDGWHGMALAESETEAQMLTDALHPLRALPPGDKKLGAMRHARNVIWAIADPRNPAVQVVLKRPVKHHLHKKLLDRLKPSKALRSWNGAVELARRGISTAEPLAWFEERPVQDLTRNCYVCNRVTDAIPASRALASIKRGKPALDIEPDELYRQLARFICDMHDRGVYFRDLSGGNILIQRSSDSLHFNLIDTGRLTLYSGRVPQSKRLEDLTRICHKLDDAGRERFARIYFEYCGRKPAAATGMRFKLYDLKSAFKRRLRKTKLYKKLKF